MKNENCQLHTGRVPKQVNPLAPESDKHLISPYYVSLNQTWKSRGKRRDYQLKQLLIVKQILIVGRFGSV